MSGNLLRRTFLRDVELDSFSLDQKISNRELLKKVFIHTSLGKGDTIIIHFSKIFVCVHIIGTWTMVLNFRELCV